MRKINALILGLFVIVANAQMSVITGKITSDNKAIGFVNIGLMGTNFGTQTDSVGYFMLEKIPEGNYKIRVSFVGYENFEKEISVKNNDTLKLKISLEATDKNLNEVVVTGVTRATLIRENPIAIISISPKQIERATESNIIDVLVKSAPGLNAVKTGPNISKPFIRGLGYNRVLTLYDGIRQEGQQWGDEHGIEVDAYNIDHAEVIKGAASLLYGSDALAGVVSLFPFVPKNDDGKLHGKFTTEYQTNNNLIGNGLQLNYARKVFVAAARGSFRMAKNYRNAVDGRVYNTNFQETNFSTLFGYKSSKGFSQINFTLYNDLQGIPDGSRDSLTRKFTQQIYEGANDDIKNRPIISDEDLNSYALSPLHQHIQHYRIYTKHSYEIGKGNIDALLAFQQNIRREYNHPTDVQQAGMYVRLNTVNYGFRYDAPKFAGVEISVGINGMLQQNKSLNATDFPIPDYNLYDGGVFVYAKWKYQKWTVSGGVRYDIREVQWSNFYVATNPQTGFSEHVNYATSDLQFSAYKKLFQGLSASVGATYQITNQISLKANVGRGYRAPNITEIGSNGLDPGAHIIYEGNRNFSPEFSLQEDIGASANFNDFSIDVSLFNNNIQNYIYLSMLVDANGNPIVDAQGNKTYQYQQSSAQLFGLEAQFSLHPEKLKGFSFDNSFALVYGFNRNKIYKGDGVNGEYLPFIPPSKLLSSISYEYKPKSIFLQSLTPKIEVEFSAKQNRYLGLNNTETPTAAYVLLNVGITAEVHYSQTNAIQFQVSVNNLLNTVYQSNLSRLKYFEYYAQLPNGRSGIYSMGRNICVKMILPF